jgi:nitroimidazol reductase NimA-like FMN-containing flavoprotein (pyridoxamine 5'-phosphate oxidase superfamily)
MSSGDQEWRGRVGAMTDDERDAFLERGVVMRLACLDEDGFPYVVPVWQEWRDGRFWVVPRARSAWAEHLRRDGRVGFVVDVADTLEKVIGRGLAELVEEPNTGGRWVEVATRMSVRYLGPNGPSYLEPTLGQPRWLFAIAPTRLETWQGVGWARRYWVEDTSGPTYDEAHGLDR